MTRTAEEMADSLSRARTHDILRGYTTGHYGHRQLQELGLVTDEWCFLPRGQREQPKIGLSATVCGEAVRSILESRNA